MTVDSTTTLNRLNFQLFLCLEQNKIDDPHCVWKDGLVVSTSTLDLGMLPETECVSECYKKQLRKEGYNGAAVGINGNKINHCLCLIDEVFIMRDTRDGDYRTCFFKMLGTHFYRKYWLLNSIAVHVRRAV